MILSCTVIEVTLGHTEEEAVTSAKRRFRSESFEYEIEKVVCNDR